jgi:DNA-binding NtrC family response regulator
MAKIAVIDDDPDLRDVFSWMLKSARHEVSTFPDGGEFLARISQNPATYDLVLSDFHLANETGLDIFARAKQAGLYCPFLIITAFGDFDTAVQAMKLGVSDYLIKPVEEEILLQKIGTFLQSPSVEQELVLQKLGSNIIAESAAMRTILQKLSRLAESKASVLLTGESGTGKEVLARMLHDLSSRNKGNFVGVNVSAIPETLFEGEFFGYRKGAFTDAVRDHEGYARLADGGTLFLDELGELKLSSQAKLLRLLEERKVQPLGSKETYSVGIRVISATNRDLLSMIKEGRFREDLYYRLAVVSVHIPPLRQRNDDIIPLARHLLRELCKEEGRQILDFTPAAQEKMMAYSWPGNVRELKNRIYEAVLIANEKWIDSDDLNLPGEQKTSRRQPLNYEEARAHFEKRYVMHLLKTTGGNINKAAALSGLTRKTIYEMMKRHDIAPESFRRHYFK